MVLRRGVFETPETQTQAQVPRSHLEILKREIVSALKRHVHLKAAWEWNPSVDLAQLLTRANLPACVFRCEVLDDGQHLRTMPRAICWEVVPNTFLFDPKFSGTASATQPGYLVDSSKSFDDFLMKVRPGDIAAKVRDVAGGVEVLAYTRVLDVEPEQKRVRVQDDLFPTGTRYELHWPLDVQMVYLTSRYVRFVCDFYADAGAPYGSGATLEEVDRACRSWWQTHLACLLLERYAAAIADEYRSHDLSQLVGAASQSYLRRLRTEVGLFVGEIVGVPWPTVESVQIGVVGVHDGDTAVVRKTVQVTEDDSRIVL